MIPLMAFTGSIFSLALIYSIGKVGKGGSMSRLILTGMAISITLNAVSSFLMFIVPRETRLRSIFAWTLGSLASARWDNLLILFLAPILGSLFFYRYARAYDLMSLGDETAIGLGVDVKRVRKLTIVIVAFVCGISVAGGGLIGLVGIIGPNGSGKTTMVKHFYRAINPKASTVFIYGEDINNLNYRQSAQKVSVMRQENTSDFKFTVMDMVMLGRSPYLEFFESFKESDRKIAYDALKKVGMTAYVDKDYAVLSGGEKQRVLIARALVQQADILILDEPTNHLDVYYQWSLMDSISKLNKTVISVFHDLNLAAAFCQKLFVIKAGKIILEGTPQEVLTEKLLGEIFNVKVTIIEDEGHPYVIYKGALSS